MNVDSIKILRCSLRLRKDTKPGVKVKRDGDHSDHSSSSNSEESSSLSLHSTAIRRDRMAATSLPEVSLFSCSRCASTFRRLKPKREVVKIILSNIITTRTYFMSCSVCILCTDNHIQIPYPPCIYLLYNTMHLVLKVNATLLSRIRRDQKLKWSSIFSVRFLINIMLLWFTVAFTVASESIAIFTFWKS